MLDNFKIMLGFTDEDEKRDKRLQLLIDNAISRLCILLGGIEPPESLEYIILDVATIRFNKIGSEGLTSHSVEGESMSFNENDFAGFKDDIQAFLDSQKEVTRGKVRFI